jgi:hypothetical protein
MAHSPVRTAPAHVRSRVTPVDVTDLFQGARLAVGEAKAQPTMPASVNLFTHLNQVPCHPASFYATSVEGQA